MLKELGLYIHIPFCVKKCNYCDFNSFCIDGQDQDLYVETLLSEIDRLKKYTKDYYINTVFMGGGTPSVLSNENIKLICNKIKSSFYISDDLEFTIECNPGTVNLGDMKKYKEFGINRISMGVQSLDNDMLKTLGRIHSLTDFIEAYAAAKVAGFENINFDLMFALPNQTLNDFKYTLEKIVKFEPTHISAYGLQLEEGTYLYNNKEAYVFPEDELDREMYHTAIDFLKNSGYEHYEISNFAKTGFESRHNLKYWEQKEYIGIGCGASSFFKNVRYQNPSSIVDYQSFVENFKPLFVTTPQNSQKDNMNEFMFLGLRKIKGVCDNEFKTLFNESFFDVYGKVIDSNIKNGLLVKAGDILHLSEKGLDLANQVMSDFV